MTRQSRRQFLGTTAGLAGMAALGAIDARAALAAKVKVGACVVGLEAAKSAGLDGVEVWAGGPAETLDIAKPEVIANYKRQMAETGLPIRSLMMGLFNDCPLATDPRATSWMEQAIDGAAALGAKVILLAFFGNGDLLDADGHVKTAEVASAIAKIKAVAPRAAEKGVVLGIENYLNGRQNLRILNAIGSPAVQVYFDVYNTGVTKGHDVPADIRLLKDRIAQFHFKNGGDFLDKGNVDFPAIAGAIGEIGYDGWVVLETSSPTGDAVADARRNGEYVRKLFA